MPPFAEKMNVATGNRVWSVDLKRTVCCKGKRVFVLLLACLKGQIYNASRRLFGPSVRCAARCHNSN